jgi:hypothetical protein
MVSSKTDAVDAADEATPTMPPEYHALQDNTIVTVWPMWSIRGQYNASPSVMGGCRLPLQLICLSLKQRHPHLDPDPDPEGEVFGGRYVGDIEDGGTMD